MASPVTQTPSIAVPLAKIFPTINELALPLSLN